jgi:hypothetical protein
MPLQSCTINIIIDCIICTVSLCKPYTVKGTPKWPLIARYQYRPAPLHLNTYKVLRVTVFQVLQDQLESMAQKVQLAGATGASGMAILSTSTESL